MCRKRYVYETINAGWYERTFILSRVRDWVFSTAATTGLLYQHQMIGDGDVEKSVEWRLVWETDVVGENLPQHHFVHHKSHMTRGWNRAATVNTT
jgi:hypothetical protein